MRGKQEKLLVHYIGNQEIFTTPGLQIQLGELPTETQENNQASKDDDDKKIKEGFSFIFG